MDITVSVRDGWALLTDTSTGRTAVCIPEVLPDRMTFHLKGWHATYDDAYLVIAAMDALGVSITDFDGGGSSEEVDQEPPQEIAAEPA
jgi:hypothetical protein